MKKANSSPNVENMQITRRTFLKAAAVAGGGLIVGASWQAAAARLAGAGKLAPGSGQFGITAWVRIAPDNLVTLIVSQAEIGQGISTTLPAILADELGADWEKVALETAPASSVYGNPRVNNWMFTGNSESIQSFYDHMRKIGAGARTMLLDAAAKRWNASASECEATGSFVVHASGRRLSFGELAEEASRLEVPQNPVLKPRKLSKVDGVALQRIDIPSKVDGTAIFGIDFSVPGMLHAAVRTAPNLGGAILPFNAAKAMEMPGVVAVVPVEGGVAVVADTYWRAKSALLSMDLQFAPGPNASLSSASVRAAMRGALENGPFVTPVNHGNALALPGRGSKVIEAEFENPFLVHATMEPMNCVASVSADRCEVWAPTQGQSLAVQALKAAMNLPEEKIFVNRTPYIGGGFGRRLLPDFVVQAALISRSVGKPVKVIWDREEDLRRSAYRPATMVRLSATLDAAGMPVALTTRVVSPTIMTLAAPFLAQVIQEKQLDFSAMEGAENTRYEIANRRVDFHLFKTPIPTTFMRTTGYGPNIFALESFIDELAHAAKHDSYQYRRKLLARDARALAVLDRAARMADWGRPHKSGPGAKFGRGIAFTDAFGTLLAMVIDIEAKGKSVRVKRVFAAVDCGRVLDPGIAASSIEGGIVFGLAGCKSEITFKGGRIEQDNFSAYRMPTLAETPHIRVEFIDGGAKLGGIGEVSPVTVAPALANALFAATGTRLRAMPIARAGYDFV